MAVAAGVVLMFGVITALRFSVEGVGDGYTLLYVLPVALAALHFRLAGGLAAAAVAVLLVVVWAEVMRVDVGLVGYLTRAMTFFLLGGLVGFETRQLRRAQDERERLLARVQAISRTDQLTGLANRRAWDEALRREIARARRDDTVMTVALLDLDRFKQFNDELGHSAGDELLRRAAGDWRREVRAVDTIARYGGEEFAVLLCDCAPEQAAQTIERLRAATPMGQTVSAGIAQWDGRETADALIERADRALYDAKRTGRDRSVRAPAA